MAIILLHARTVISPDSRHMEEPVAHAAYNIMQSGSWPPSANTSLSQEYQGDGPPGFRSGYCHSGLPKLNPPQAEISGWWPPGSRSGYCHSGLPKLHLPRQKYRGDGRLDLGPVTAILACLSLIPPQAEISGWWPPGFRSGCCHSGLPKLHLPRVPLTVAMPLLGVPHSQSCLCWEVGFDRRVLLTSSTKWTTCRSFVF